MCARRHSRVGGLGGLSGARGWGIIVFAGQSCWRAMLRFKRLAGTGAGIGTGTGTGTGLLVSLQLRWIYVRRPDTASRPTTDASLETGLRLDLDGNIDRTAAVSGEPNTERTGTSVAEKTHYESIREGPIITDTRRQVNATTARDQHQRTVNRVQRKRDSGRSELLKYTLLCTLGRSLVSRVAVTHVQRHMCRCATR